MRFQAIDNYNVAIENILEGEAPQTLEGAAQAFQKGFPADYSSFDEEELKKSWKKQEKERRWLQYGE